MTGAFDDQPWHDAALLGIYIDRREPGKRDEIALEIHWPDGTESDVVFTDCYFAAMTMNFGIIASESILGATEHADSPLLQDVRTPWARLGTRLDALRCFDLEMNSTGSRIQICALAWSIRGRRG